MRGDSAVLIASSTHVVDVGRPHDALVVGGHVHEQLVQVHVLLVMGADQVVEGVAGDRQHRLAVALGVVEAVEQVDAAGAGGGHAHAQAAGELGIAAGGKGRRLLVTHLDESHLVLCVRKASKIPLTPSPGSRRWCRRPIRSAG